MYTKMVYIKTGKADTSTDSSFAAGFSVSASERNDMLWADRSMRIMPQPPLFQRKCSRPCSPSIKKFTATPRASIPWGGMQRPPWKRPAPERRAVWAPTPTKSILPAAAAKATTGPSRVRPGRSGKKGKTTSSPLPLSTTQCCTPARRWKRKGLKSPI